MPLDQPDIRNLVQEFTQTGEITSLRLPNQLSRIERIGSRFLGFLALFSVLGGVITVIERKNLVVGILFGLGVPTLLAIVAFLLLRVARWGVKLTITPDRVMFERHARNGGRCLELYPEQIHFQIEGGAILAGERYRNLPMGTLLEPEERQSVVDFLNHLISRRNDPVSANVPRVALGGSGVEVSDPLATWQTVVEAGESRSAPPLGSATASLDQLTLALRFRKHGAQFVHLAPDIPEQVLAAAYQRYLDLEEEEVLLGVIGVGNSGSEALGCAITNRRIYWPGKAAGNSADPATVRGGSGDYESIENVKVLEGRKAVVDLGNQQRIILGGGHELAVALVDYIQGSKCLARGENVTPSISSDERDRAAAVWPRLLASSRRHRNLHSEILAFQRQFQIVSSPIITRILAVACVLVFGLMVLSGVSIMNPLITDLIGWGGNFGPSVVIDHQYWRLFTCMFVHIGLFHLAMNMFCLIGSGRTIERLFGHDGFLLLYLLSGSGGAIASLWYHPLTVSAGASGAIFGLFGGLLGFLAIRHRSVPLVVLKPLRASAFSFVAYNTILGAMNPAIDTAAHLGGLVTGFVCGLLFTAVSRSPGQINRISRFVRISAVAAFVLAVLAALGVYSRNHARNALMADPRISPFLQPTDDGPAQQWNAFSKAVTPIFPEFDRITDQINELLLKLDNSDLDQAAKLQNIHEIQLKSEDLAKALATLPAENPELAEIARHYTTTASFQLKILRLLEEFVISGDERLLDGPESLEHYSSKIRSEFETIKSLNESYFRTHGLTKVEANP